MPIEPSKPQKPHRSPTSQTGSGALLHDSVTPQLARFLGDLTYDRIPDAAIRQAKKGLADNLSTILSGLRSAPAKKFTDAVLGMGESPDAYLIGTRQHASVRAVAMHAAALLDVVNGMSGFRSAVNPGTHPLDVVLPVALAVAQTTECSGKQFLTALLAGMETHTRISLAVDPSHRQKGFFSDATVGSLAGSVVASKLRGGSAALIEATLGISAVFTPISLLQLVPSVTRADAHYGWWKMLSTPYAARASIDAAFFAEQDFGGQKYPLENPRGFCFATSDEPTIGALTQDLGRTYMSEFAYYKLFCTARALHGAIDLTLDICRTQALNAPDIESVRVETVQFVSARNARTSPTTHLWECLTASVPYVVALAILHSDELLSPDLYTDFSRPSRLPAVHEYAARVHVVEEPAFNQQFPGKIPTRVEIRTRGGKTHAASSDFFRGDEPELPRTQQELDDKFRRFAGMALPSRQVALIKEMLDHLEEVDEMRVVLDSLTPKGD